MSEANKTQVGGEHYKSTFQHWDFVDYLGLTYYAAQVTRYMARWRKKAGIQDLEKALHYMDKYIEVETKRRTEHRTLLEEFIREHKLQEHERTVFNMLVNFNLGDEDRLVEAREAIAQLLRIVKGEEPSCPTKAPIPEEYYRNNDTPEDPKFREDGDEWKRDKKS